MSEMKFSCPGCGQHISCDTSYAGKEIACPACQARMVVPGEAPAAASEVRVSANACPGCGAAVAAGAVLCTNCGLNLHTGQRLRSQTAGPAPGRATLPQPAKPSLAKSGSLWAGVALAALGVLFLVALTNEKAAIVFQVVQIIFSLGVGIMILVAAFQDSVGQGFLTLCVPCYIFYFVFARNDSQLLKMLFLVSILTRLAGLLVKLPEGFMDR